MTAPARQGTPAPDPTAAVRGRRIPRRMSGRELVLGFGRHEVVHGVDIELRPGAVTALVGPNGSGKSTLLRGLARLHAPESGSILLGGDVEAPDSDDRRDDVPTEAALAARDGRAISAKEFAREVTLFAQTRSAPTGLSVREIVDFGRHPYRRRFSGPTDADRDAVERAMAATGLLDLAGRAAGELSGGELQRVWLACCLAQETGVVLLDEPTNHLDLRFQTETLDLIRDLADRDGVAVGVVLHDLDHAARVADDVVLMAHGRVVAVGSALEVLTAEHLTAAYDVRVEVRLDEYSGHLRIDPVSRHDLRVRRS